MRQLIGAALARPVVWNEYRVRTNRADHQRLQAHGRPPRRDFDPIARLDSMPRGELRVNLQLGLGILIDERSDATRLRARKVLADDAPGREIDGKFAVH